MTTISLFPLDVFSINTMYRSLYMNYKDIEQTDGNHSKYEHEFSFNLIKIINVNFTINAALIFEFFSTN